MVINNPYYIKNEIKKPIETVYEVKEDYKVPSFEEFMKTYEVDEGVVESYRDELGGYDDIGVEKSYGPGAVLSGPPGRRGSNFGSPSFGGPDFGSPNFGSRSSHSNYSRRNNDNSDEMVSFVAKTAIKAVVATEITVATGGLAPLIGGGIWAGGKWLESKNDDFLHFLGKGMSDIGSGVFSGGLFSNSTVGEFVEKSGINLKDLERFFVAKGGLEAGYSIEKHNKHRSEGISYKRDCDVCNF